MKFTAQQLVTKISVSDVLAAKAFYEDILGFQVDDRYTLNVGGTYQTESYMQLNAPSSSGGAFTLGLFKDIDQPFVAMPQTGTVPSFVVDDIRATLQHLLAHAVGVVVSDPNAQGDDRYIVKNTSDEGYVDLFFFFHDRDNNAFVMRQNLGKGR